VITDETLILLVEDNPDDVDLTLRAFQRSRLKNTVVVARDGAEALDYLFGTGVYDGRDTRQMPTLVLLDIKLPKVDGLEVLTAIRQNPTTELLPIVILTSSDEQEDLIKSYRGGANSYVRKPVNFVQFMEAVQQLGLYWLVLNESPLKRK
jgi:two-component system response regulator